jgi:hypothetical protein
MNPYISICMGIGGNLTDDLLARLKFSTNNNSALAKQFGLDAEIVITEWNLPLRSTGEVEIAMRGSKIPVRIIHTPRELHGKVPNPHGFKYFEWYPKNISLRRARGEFLLSTNPDDIWPRQLAEFFSRRELQSGHFYRVNRHDMRDGKVFAVLHPTGPKRLGATEAEIRKVDLPNCCPWSENMIHYSAAGDFTLMSREDWFMIHGNPEREYNDSVDGQTLWLAHTKGLKQVVLPYPLYHPDHPRTLNHAYVPGWDDNKPHAKMNGDNWGFADMEFEETVL